MSMDNNCVAEAQTLLRNRLCRHDLPPQIFSYAEERCQLHGLVKRSAEVGESNSIIILGPRGSGKTMLLKSVLEELCEDKKIRNNLLQVHLNGLLQTDDRIALKEITRQLQLENTVGDKVFGSFAENLQFLLDALKSGGKQSKTILFVLEEFDLFAQHKNQTLLYNLFDVSQSRQAPVCVVGITSRMDVLELLEKRVKSRFSHRQLYLLPTFNYETYKEMFVSFLSLPADFKDKKYASQWNKKIQSLVKEGGVQDILRSQYNLSKDVRALQNLLVLPVCQLSHEHPFLEAQQIVDAARNLRTDSKSSMLHGVSVLELCLIIAMKHLTDLYQGEPFNFEMILNEYRKFAQRRSSMQMFERAVVMKAFEHLCALELVIHTDTASSRVQKEYRLTSLLVDNSQVMDALQKYPGCPMEVKQWASSSMT